VNRIWQIIRHEIFVTIRRKGYLFMTFGVPVIAAIAVVAYITLQSGEDENGPQNPLDNLPKQSIGYVDHSGLFGDPGELASVIVPYPDEAAARAALEKGELGSYYVIAADYVQGGEVTRVAPQLNITRFGGSELFRAFLILQLLGDKSPHLLLRLYQPARVVEHQLDATGAELSQMDEEQRYGSNFILVYGFAMILLMSTLIPSGYLLQSVVGEKENRTIEVVLSSLRPVQLLAGKVLGQGAMGLLQVMIWLGSGWTLFELASGELPTLRGIELTFDKIVIALLYFVGGFLLIACFQAGLGAISTNMREGPQYATVFTLPMVIPLMLLSIFIEEPNGSLAVILSLFPITAPLSMVQRIAITAVPAWQLALSLILLVIGVLFTLWSAAKIFRVNTLLAGTLPRPAELIKLLREA
jgi:ABC-2 type transport system permease protein